MEIGFGHNVVSSINDAKVLMRAAQREQRRGAQDKRNAASHQRDVQKQKEIRAHETALQQHVKQVEIKRLARGNFFVNLLPAEFQLIYTTFAGLAKGLTPHEAAALAVYRMSVHGALGSLQLSDDFATVIGTMRIYAEVEAENSAGVCSARHQREIGRIESSADELRQLDAENDQLKRLGKRARRTLREARRGIVGRGGFGAVDSSEAGSRTRAALFVDGAEAKRAATGEARSRTAKSHQNRMRQVVDSSQARTQQAHSRVTGALTGAVSKSLDIAAQVVGLFNPAVGLALQSAAIGVRLAGTGVSNAFDEAAADLSISAAGSERSGLIHQRAVQRARDHQRTIHQQMTAAFSAELKG